MKVLYSPQRSDDKISYSFEGDVITVYLGDQSDIFDFTGTPDGKLVLVDEEDNSLIETSLIVDPIKSVYREDGILYVELLYYHSADATKEELFPEWTDSEDLKVGVYSG